MRTARQRAKTYFGRRNQRYSKTIRKRDSFPSISFSNSSEISSLLSNLSIAHSDEIEYNFINDLDKDGEQYTEFVKKTFDEKREKKHLIPDDVKEISSNFLKNLIKKTHKERPPSNNGTGDKDNKTIPTKYGTFNLIKTPTISGGEIDAALKLKKDLKGETTIISPDNYTIDNEVDKTQEKINTHRDKSNSNSFNNSHVNFKK
jgi:hypothetical protein